MTRLDSAIARLKAQRVCLGFAAEALKGREGCVLELGLGNGRTYDHIRSLMPEREIYVFDRRIAAHPDTIPPEEYSFVGEMTETLPRAVETLRSAAVLVHGDIGGGGIEASRRNAAEIGPLIVPLVQPDGLVMVDQELHCEGLVEMPLPEGVPLRRYFIYRRAD
ncbi:MAG: class I SAM-dependent methyltransferase [Rickettsiales bacterium]